MPYYEVTYITRSLSKNDLFTVLKRAATTLLSNGAIIMGMESLGHRDLPYKRISRVDKQPVYTTNMFLMKTYMPLETKRKVLELGRNDTDLIHIAIVSSAELDCPPFECNLEEILKPPAQRKSVEDLRNDQKLGRFTRQMIFKRTEMEWKSIPKSYPIPPPRS
ncbi:unnamed protein product [Dracunculus medinensis]|uniref:Small ribosomal subunit protein bS6m n=1 Tax=Dracunculus medinensis TaxID=318479 RepID=A0A0N4U620_DRAME|nr:unnamed protein product [Dracunculus medinensis]